jgi:CheY-like chemotaxis protein
MDDYSTCLVACRVSAAYAVENLDTVLAFRTSPNLLESILILMDMDLPDISGIDAARAVKSNPRTAHIPIIRQTGGGSSRWKAAALAAGIVAYRQKPASMELIISTVEKFL